MIAVIGMISRIELSDGHYIDGRIILVGISAAYAHPIAGIVSALLVSMFRVSLGGAGVPIGVIGICGGALVGMLFFKSNKSIPKMYSPVMLLIFGLLLTLQAQVWIPILYPWDVAIILIKKVSLVGIISYPLGTLLIGSILNTLIQFEKRAVALKDSKERWRSLTETSPDHILTLDTDLNIQFANYSAPGLTVNELIGTPLYQYVEGKEKQDEVKAILESVLNTGRLKSYETDYNTPEGETIYYESSVIPRILEGSKKIIGLTISSRNMTERKNMEDEMVSLKEFYQHILEKVEDGIWVTDSEDVMIYFNPGMEKIAGVKSADMLGLMVTRDFPEETIQHFIQFYSKAKNSLQSQQYESQVITPAGRETIQAGNLVPRIKNGIYDGMICTIRDITERKQAEEKISSSLEEKETLLQEIHHRVKNNMQVINSLLKLQADNIEDNQIKEILKESQGRVYAMSAVHETLHGSENLSDIDLKTYLSKITTSIFQTYAVNPAKVSLKNDIEDSPININQAYPLGLIVNELVSNSLKYAFPEESIGEICLSMKKIDKELKIIMMDNGIGMPAGLDWKSSSTLGLKLVRTLVENQLDGSIEMESKDGTKFTIKFSIET
ncbi:MAG: PAS domain S-box protein [Deltaproteobacteria bacterium]|nr:PAS domain S-box protein [Deltaproteobacteria bacterium]